MNRRSFPKRAGAAATGDSLGRSAMTFAVVFIVVILISGVFMAHGSSAVSVVSGSERSREEVRIADHHDMGAKPISDFSSVAPARKDKTPSDDRITDAPDESPAAVDDANPNMAETVVTVTTAAPQEPVIVPVTGPVDATDLAEKAKNPGITEIIGQDPVADGAVYNYSTAGGFVSSVEWQGKCWYRLKNFCVIRGVLTVFHDPKVNKNATGHHLRMCNEFSQHSPNIRLKYRSEPLPAVLPAPLMTKTQGWVLQFWCQDLYHMTLTLLPAFHTKKHLGDHPDIYFKIAKGKRKKAAYCRIKLGHPASYEVVRNPKWGGDTQFPFAGNPYWPFYKTISPEPHRIHPLYDGATQKTACYTKGAVDKLYIKEMWTKQAREYSNTLLGHMNVTTDDVLTKALKRRCGKNGEKRTVLVVDRRGRTRRLTNIPEIVEAAKAAGYDAQSVQLEKLSISNQLARMTGTDILLGMHGNAMTWVQFLPAGAVLMELVGVWYTPYAKLWGHTHLHSSMKNNMAFKRGGEFQAFAHNITEVTALLAQATKVFDDFCAAHKDGDNLEPENRQLQNLYKDCAPHC
jgi:hypothetical protein